MKKIQEISLLDVLPTSVLEDKKMRASALALDEELRKLTLVIDEVLHLPRLEKLSGKILDFLAEQFHIDFYEPLYLTEVEKKNLIRESIAWHRIKGTAGAVEKITHDAFRDSEIIEWFEYGGKPYFFKIKLKGYKYTPDGFRTFLRLLWSAKNVRSWLEAIIIEWPDQEIKLFAGMVNTRSGTQTYKIKTPENLPKSRNFIGQILFKTGVITLKNDNSKPVDIDENWLRLFFKFPSITRQISLPNPAENDAELIEKITDLSDWTVDKNILTDFNEEATTGIVRACIIQRKFNLIMEEKNG